MFNKFDISFRIKRLRLQFRLNQNQFIDGLDVSRQALSSIEKGESGLSLGLFYKIIKKYKVRPIWLLEGTGDMLEPTENLSAEIPEPEKNEIYERLLRDKDKVINELQENKEQYKLLYNLMKDKLGKELNEKY